MWKSELYPITGLFSAVFQDPGVPSLMKCCKFALKASKCIYGEFIPRKDQRKHNSLSLQVKRLPVTILITLDVNGNTLMISK